MINVVCVLRTGERVVGGEYGPEHVRKLRAGVERHMGMRHRFVCLTDTDVECESIPLMREWPGWWSKINLFYPGLFTGPTVYLDLDTVVVGSLAPLVRTEPGFSMVSDFYRAEMGNSSVMSWMGDYCEIFQRFSKNPKHYMMKYDSFRGPRIGDQGFIHGTLGERAEFFPEGSVLSYKRHCRRTRPLTGSVVSFHGTPKCDQPESRWAYDDWSSL